VKDKDKYKTVNKGGTAVKKGKSIGKIFGIALICLAIISSLMPIVLSVSPVQAATYLDFVRVYWYENGTRYVRSVSAGGETTINRDAGSKVDVRIYRTADAPVPVTFYTTDTTNGVTRSATSSNLYEDLLDCVGALPARLFAYVNTLEGSVTIWVNNLEPPDPDLVVSHITVDGTHVPRTYQVGEEVEVECIVWNLGEGTAGSSRLGYYIGTSSTDTSNRWDADSVGVLAKDAGSPESEYYTFQEADVGTRYFVFHADYLNEVDEGDYEGNNRAHFGPFTVERCEVTGVSIDIDPEDPQEVAQGGTVTGDGSIAGTGSCTVEYRWMWRKPGGVFDSSPILSTSMSSGSASIPTYDGFPTSNIGQHKVWIRIESPGGPLEISNNEYYTVCSPPTISGVSPDTGYLGETKDVTITGTEFASPASVSFGSGIEVNSSSVNSDSEIIANINIAYDAASGPRNVSVTTECGTGMLADGFTVKQQCETQMTYYVTYPDSSLSCSSDTASSYGITGYTHECSGMEAGGEIWSYIDAWAGPGWGGTYVYADPMLSSEPWVCPRSSNYRITTGFDYNGECHHGGLWGFPFGINSVRIEFQFTIDIYDATSGYSVLEHTENIDPFPIDKLGDWSETLSLVDLQHVEIPSIYLEADHEYVFRFMVFIAMETFADGAAIATATMDFYTEQDYGIKRQWTEIEDLSPIGIDEGDVCDYGLWEPVPGEKCEERRLVYRCSSGSCVADDYESRNRPDGVICDYGSWEDIPGNPCEERRLLYTCSSGSCAPDGYEYRSRKSTLTVAVDGVGATAPMPGTHTYDRCTDVTITIMQTDPNWEFSHWSGDVSGSKASITILMDDNKSVIAHFAPQRTITFYTDPPAGGTITFDDSAYSNGQSTTRPDDTYPVSANPAPNYEFDHWSTTGGMSVSNPDSQFTTATVTGDGSIKAWFNYIPPQRTITFYTDPPAGGTITFDGSAYSNGQSTTRPDDTYPVSANPAPNYEFDHWSTTGGASVSNPDSQFTTATVTGDGSIKAWFNYIPPQRTITFYTDPPAGGTITFDDSAYSNGQSTTKTDDTYPVSANPAPNCEFDHWSTTGGASVSNPDSQSTTATVTGDGSIKAWFTAFEATADISVALQGGSRPPECWEVPITIKFFSPGADVMTDTPIYEFHLTTTKSDGTATCQCAGVMPGTYDITAQASNCPECTEGNCTLTNVKRSVVISTPSTAVDMGILLAGDANCDGIINISDFGILAVSYMCTEGEPCYDCRADFDCNGITNISDFGLLAVNYMKMSPIDIS